MNLRKFGPYLWALLAAALYGVSTPLSKQLLCAVSPMALAAFLYLGAGVGMLLLRLGRTALGAKQAEARLTKAEIPYVVLMILLDVAAPILLMTGLVKTTAANATLLNNFEIVATSLIALTVFKEAIGGRQWVAIALVTTACIVLTVEDVSAFAFSAGSLFVLLACVCWGFENNCTRKLSLKDPAQIVVIKGWGSGLGALLVALTFGQPLPSLGTAAVSMLLGFVSYGLSIYCYIVAQRALGAARTSAFYAVAPFLGAAVAILAFGERITASFAVAAAIMVAGTALFVSEKHRHAHMHGALAHEHRHTHDDGHHCHPHETPCEGAHSHYHQHEQVEHEHEHLPDMHHHHAHSMGH